MHMPDQEKMLLAASAVHVCYIHIIRAAVSISFLD
jgi:hypothetical protein